MSELNRHDSAAWLNAASNGDREAQELVFQRLRSELRAIAESQLRGERRNHTLQPTALINEAYIKMFGNSQTQWRDRGHFLGAASRAMRQICVDHARTRTAKKRQRPESTPLVLSHEIRLSDLDVLVVDEAMRELRTRNEQHHALVELKVFGGLTIQQTASALGVSVNRVKDDWKFVRAWLLDRLETDT